MFNSSAMYISFPEFLHFHNFINISLWNYLFICSLPFNFFFLFRRFIWFKKSYHLLLINYCNWRFLMISTINLMKCTFISAYFPASYPCVVRTLTVLHYGARILHSLFYFFIFFLLLLFTLSQYFVVYFLFIEERRRRPANPYIEFYLVLVGNVMEGIAQVKYISV